MNTRAYSETRMVRWLSIAMIALAPAITLRANSPAITYTGTCDASAVVALNEQFFAVADDEDSIIRVYSRDRGGPPTYAVDLSGFLQLGVRKGETDLEGAARIGDAVFWISSHGRNANGKFQQSRHRLFATTASVSNGVFQVQPVGSPYTRLIEDMERDPRLAPFKLAAAARLAPKSSGALNIEGLCATPEGHLLIGFRNPLPAGRALVVPLLNPLEVIAGRAAQFGNPWMLDLGGLGIRSMSEYRNGYLIVAGSPQSGGASRLYAWRADKEQPVWIERANMGAINPEGLAAFPGADSDRLLVLSDDGTMQIDCVECKKLKDPTQKRFRAVSLDLSREPLPTLDQPAMSMHPPGNRPTATAPFAQVIRSTNLKE